MSDDKQFTVAHTKNYTKVLLPRDDTLVGCSALVTIDASARFHVTGTVVSRSEPPTAAAAAIRSAILAGGHLTSAEHANLLSSVDATSAASCGGDSGCGSCEDSDTSALSSTGATGCGSSGSGCCGGVNKTDAGCCGGGGGAGCCSTDKATTSKYKKTEASSSTASLKSTKADAPAPASSLSDRIRALCDDRVALAAVATIAASAALITTRLLFARK